MKQSTKYLKILCNMIAAILILVFVICIVPRLISYFMPFVVGFLLALIANPVVKFLEKKIKPFRTIEKLSSFVGDLLFKRQSKLVLTKHRNFVTLE